ncbi:MAG TPA: DUF2314 domain-containing protein [Planctomycetota bacterium]|nr:DUF2314 domain-containing protein [Planctomycetota bacterium]
MSDDADRQDEGDDLSALYAFWPEGDAPLEEEVRLALLAAFPEATLTDELDPQDDLVWGQVWKIPGLLETVVWVEERGDFNEELLESGRLDADELEAARRSRFFLGVETPPDVRMPLDAFQTQVRVLEAACVPGLIAVYDDNAVVVRSGRAMRALAGAAAAPRPSALFEVHELGGPRGLWVHTHGLMRFGLPELELLGVSDSERAPGADLLHAAVDAILGGAEPDEDRVLAVGDGLEVRLAPVSEAMKMIPVETAESRRAHEDDDGDDHRGPRLCLLAKDRNETPHETLDRLAEDVAVFKSRQESERQRQLAVGRFGTFGELFALRRREGWRFHAKLAFPKAQDSESREHLWFEVFELKPGRLRGACLNAPVDVAEVREGEEGWFDLDRLTDWTIVAPQGEFSPESAAVLLQDA